MLLSFEPIETVRGLDKVNNDTKIVFNTHPIVPASSDKPYPGVGNITDVLKENFKHVLPIDSKESVIAAMKNNLKPKFHELNLKAIESGYNWIKG